MLFSTSKEKNLRRKMQAKQGQVRGLAKQHQESGQGPREAAPRRWGFGKGWERVNKMA